jgi:hypothetical protein
MHKCVRPPECSIPDSFEIARNPRGERRTLLARRWPALLVVLLAAASAAALVLAPTPAPPAVPVPACSAVLVVGLRGSGDPLTRDGGMGADTAAVAHRLSRQLPAGLAVTLLGYPYDSGPVWRVAKHVTAAAGQLGGYLAGRHRRCPVERLIVIGQSEGAAVVHLALPALGAQLAAAVLLADPARLAGAPYDASGGSHDGILAGPLLGGWRGLVGGDLRDNVPAPMAMRVSSYCLPGDAVCDAGPSALLQAFWSGVHTSYRNNPGGVADAAAAFAASHVLGGGGSSAGDAR